MSVRANFADIYLRGMRDRSMRSGTKLAREIQLTDWSTAGGLSNRSTRVQIPCDICTRFGRYLHSTKGSWKIKLDINKNMFQSYLEVPFRRIHQFNSRKYGSKDSTANTKHHDKNSANYLEPVKFLPLQLEMENARKYETQAGSC